MRYLLDIPKDLDGYELEPGDFDRALRGHLDTWLGDQWSIQEIETGSDLDLAIEDLSRTI
jgi:hypothetical protein